MKIVFMGTPDFSAKVLKKLNSAYPVSAVVTNPDRPAGRGNALRPSPLKLAAEELCIPVYQYEKVSREGIADIEALSPDLIVTAAFGQILSEKFLSVPKFGVLNVHASLLPKYRGASPIQWAILNGDEYTGVTVMRTVKEVDAGDILLANRVRIGEKETAGELFDRLADLGGDAIVEAVSLLERGEAVFTPQNAEQATHCGMISKSDGLMDFSRTAKQLDCFVRGMTPWPSAYTFLKGKTLKIFEVGPSNVTAEGHDFGEVVAASSSDGLCVKVGDGAVRLKELQCEGARRMSDVEFLRGHAVNVGERLGKL